MFDRNGLLDHDAIIGAIDGPYDQECPIRAWIEQGLGWLELYVNKGGPL